MPDRPVVDSPLPGRGSPAVLLGLVLALTGCRSSAPYTIPSAAINTAIAAGASAAQRSAGGCYAQCVGRDDLQPPQRLLRVAGGGLPGDGVRPAVVPQPPWHDHGDGGDRAGRRGRDRLPGRRLARHRKATATAGLDALSLRRPAPVRHRMRGRRRTRAPTSEPPVAARPPSRWARLLRGLPARRVPRPGARRRRGPGAEPLPLGRPDPARLDGRRHLSSRGEDRRGHAVLRGGRGGRVAPPGLQARTARPGALRLAGLGHRPSGIALLPDAGPGRRSAGDRHERAGPHRHHRLLRPPRGGSAEARGDGGGLGRRRRHRLGRRPDRPDRRLPRHRDRGRPREVRLPDRRARTRRRGRLPGRGRRQETARALPEGDRRLLRQRGRPGSRRRARLARAAGEDRPLRRHRPLQRRPPLARARQTTWRWS